MLARKQVPMLPEHQQQKLRRTVVLRVTVPHAGARTRRVVHHMRALTAVVGRARIRLPVLIIVGSVPQSERHDVAPEKDPSTIKLDKSVGLPTACQRLKQPNRTLQLKGRRFVLCDGQTTRWPQRRQPAVARRHPRWRRR